MKKRKKKKVTWFYVSCLQKEKILIFVLVYNFFNVLTILKVYNVHLKDNNVNKDGSMMYGKQVLYLMVINIIVRV